MEWRMHIVIHSWMFMHVNTKKYFSKLCNKLRLYCWLVNGSLNLHVMGSILPFASFVSIEFLSFFFFLNVASNVSIWFSGQVLSIHLIFFSVQVLSIHNFFSVQVLNTHLENPAYCLMEMVSLLIARPWKVGEKFYFTSSDSHQIKCRKPSLVFTDFTNRLIGHKIDPFTKVMLKTLIKCYGFQLKTGSLTFHLKKTSNATSQIQTKQILASGN